MKEYQNLYLRCDVLLFADVFEKFRNRCLENYGAPVLSQNVMLSTTKVNLVTSDVDMYLFFEKCM